MGTLKEIVHVIGEVRTLMSLLRLNLAFANIFSNLRASPYFLLASAQKHVNANKHDVRSIR